MKYYKRFQVAGHNLKGKKLYHVISWMVQSYLQGSFSLILLFWVSINLFTLIYCVILLLIYYVADIYTCISFDSHNYLGKVIWDIVFKRKLSKFFGRQPLKNFKRLKFFKGCLPLKLFSPLLSTLPHMKVTMRYLSFLWQVQSCVQNPVRHQRQSVLRK